MLAIYPYRFFAAEGGLISYGFDPIDSGSLADGGRRQQPGTPVYNQPLDASEVQAALAKA